MTITSRLNEGYFREVVFKPFPHNTRIFHSCSVENIPQRPKQWDMANSDKWPHDPFLE